MKSTREKILETAQDLFNHYGIAKVSVRSICEAQQISTGNFTYYFPNKDKIIVELYYRMTGEIEAIPNRVEVPKESILFLLEFHKQMFLIQNTYKFFFLNTFELLTHYPEIKEVYLEHVGKERKMMAALFALYRRAGVFAPDVTKEFFDKLIDVVQMVNTFWIVEAEINFKGSERDKIVHYMHLCCSLVEPYLTTGAWKEFNEFFKHLQV